MNKPIEIEVTEQTQCKNLFFYKEGKGMCQDRIVHIEQINFGGDKNTISFELDQVEDIIEALQNLPTMTEDNEEEFRKNLPEDD